ncbi:MAG: helix-turn-helix transcriptional regulator [Oscillospiraceae bacterium]|nr:helix-turn-helix transcriptional regulator [Oscillospiraceae bacterium]
MNNEELKLRVGANIARLRRERGLTQAELAERINYSDKAVSKWERAESLPDVLTLLNLAEQLGTDLNTLTGCAPEIPEPEPMPEPAPEPEPEPVPEPEPAVKTLARRYTADKTVIQKLSSILVWVVALFLYMVLDAFGVKNLWLLFVVAVPVNAIVLLSLRSAWKLYGWNRILISIIMWGFLLTIYLLLLVVGKVNVWKILPMGLLGQMAILLWFKMFRPVEEEAHE